MACAACYGLGFVSPRTPVVQVRDVVKTVVKIETRDVAREVKGETRVVYRDRTVYRDGPVQERVVEREAVKADTVTQTDRTVYVQSENETRVTVTPTEKNWRVGALVGATWQPGLQPIHGAGPLALGLQFERHVAGPVWVGAWALSTGSAGLSVSAAW